jgi:hypothetical protein
VPAMGASTVSERWAVEDEHGEPYAYGLMGREAAERLAEEYGVLAVEYPKPDPYAETRAFLDSYPHGTVPHPESL